MAIFRQLKMFPELSNPEIPLTKSVEIYKMGLKELEVASKMLENAKIEFETLNKPQS